MRRLTYAVRLFLLVALLLFPSATTMAQGRGVKGYRAYAEFLVNPTGCHETKAMVEVIEQIVHTPPGRPQPQVTVNLAYTVKSTCEEVGDLMWYYDYHTEGAVTIDADDFDIHRGLRKATLKTTVPVFEEEAGIDFYFGVEVVWTAVNNRGSHSVEATFEFVSPELSAIPDTAIVNPIPSAVSAELSRLR